MSRYAIVKVDVIERNDVTKRHDIVTTIWRKLDVEVTALSKPTFRNESMQEKESIMIVKNR